MCWRVNLWLCNDIVVKELPPTLMLRSQIKTGTGRFYPTSPIQRFWEIVRAPYDFETFCSRSHKSKGHRMAVFSEMPWVHFLVQKGSGRYLDGWLIDWMVFYAAFNSISVISLRQLTLFLGFLGFTSTRLGSEMCCPRTLPRKNPENLVRLEPRSPRLRVKHLTTEPRGTLHLDGHRSATGRTLGSNRTDIILTLSFHPVTER